MKLHCFAFAAAAACGTHAVHAAPAVDPDNSSTVRIYQSGASALRAAMAGVVLNDICGGSASNPTTTLYNVTESGGSFVFSSTNGNFWAITCRVTAAGGAKVGLPPNTPLAFFKSDAGESNEGVFPIYLSAVRPFVQPVPTSGCTTVTADRVYTACPSTRNAVPMFGTSDIEPAKYTGSNVTNDPLDLNAATYPPDGLSAVELAQLTISPVYQTVYAVAVNSKLYNAMFEAQGLSSQFDSDSGQACTASSTGASCIPAIGRGAALSIFAGFQHDWTLLVKSSDPNRFSQINICRGVQGAAAQVAASLVLGTFPCNPNAASMADWTYSSSIAPDATSATTGKTLGNLTIGQYLDGNMGGPPINGVFPSMPAGTIFVFEGPVVGDVVSCMNRANNGNGFAIGHISLESTPGSNFWRHVRLDCAKPSRDSFKKGECYQYAAESTAQYSNAALNTFSAAQRSVILGLIARYRLPDTLAKLPAANQLGVAALPLSYPGAFGVGTPNEITFGSRMTNGGNSCNPFQAVK